MDGLIDEGGVNRGRPDLGRSTQRGMGGAVSASGPAPRSYRSWINADLFSVCRVRNTERMSILQQDVNLAPHHLWTSRVLRIQEDHCEVWSAPEPRPIRFAPMFPSPRVERVSPGHLVAIASSPDGAEVVVWRWYDAVLLGSEPDGSLRLWEPAHGEVTARPRASYEPRDPGSRVYASAGLPGAEWWVAASADSAADVVRVDLDDVDRLYTDNDLWSAAFVSDV